MQAVRLRRVIRWVFSSTQYFAVISPSTHNQVIGLVLARFILGKGGLSQAQPIKALVWPIREQWNQVQPGWDDKKHGDETKTNVSESYSTFKVSWPSTVNATAT